MLSPTIVRGVESRASQTGVLGADGDLPYELSAALVVQNYDACFAWGEALEPPGSSAAEDPTAVEVLRLMALAAVNVGRTDAAVQLLGRSEAGCRERFRLAHLAYLQGLIEAKRSYDVATSDAHYHRGLAALDETPSGSDDHQLERAWLFNGLALNRAIEWRRDPALEAKYEEAFRLVKSAFDLVRDGSSRPCGYLRFNLVANLAFLFEMKGRYDLAIDALSRAFDFGPGSPTELPSGHVALSYRVGVLHHRLGDREGAIRLLREAESVDDSPENWPTQDRILRAIGAVTLADDELEQAESAFSEGLALSRENRSAGGATEHGRGLATVLVRQGRDADAGDLVESLAVEEGVTIELPETGNTPQPNPKLPAYFPEIDLEEAPGIDLNRYLAAVGPATTSWRS
jgi:tetratricopeptide (TPR) repeat protein